MKEVNFDKTARYRKYREQYSKSLIETLIQYLGCDDKTFILDLACGAGELSVELGKYVARVIAVDKSAQMLAFAPRADNIEYVQHDLSLSPFMANTVINHIVIGRAMPYIPTDILDSIIKQSLKKGGNIAAFTCYFSEDTPWFQSYEQIRKQSASPSKRRDSPSKRRDFTGRRKMEVLGFKIDKIIECKEPIQVDADFLVYNTLSRRNTADTIRNDMEHFKQELWAAMSPYMNDGKLQGHICSAAHIYKRGVSPVYFMNKLFRGVRNIK